MKNTGTLKVELAGDRDIVMTRVFDAPRELVIAALTQPALIKRWFGPRGHQLVVCEVDFRVGGTWRYVLRAPNGHEMGMRGEYVEIALPDRMVHTESFDEFAKYGHSVCTTTYVEHAGKTTFQITVRAPSPEVRTQVIASGMEHGAAETYDRLAEVLAEQRG